MMEKSDKGRRLFGQYTTGHVCACLGGLTKKILVQTRVEIDLDGPDRIQVVAWVGAYILLTTRVFG